MKKLVILATLGFIISSCFNRSDTLSEKEIVIPAISTKTLKCAGTRIARTAGLGGSGLDIYVTVDSSYTIHVFQVSSNKKITELKNGEE